MTDAPTSEAPPAPAAVPVAPAVEAQPAPVPTPEPAAPAEEAPTANDAAQAPAAPPELAPEPGFSVRVPDPPGAAPVAPTKPKHVRARPVAEKVEVRIGNPVRPVPVTLPPPIAGTPSAIDPRTGWPIVNGVPTKPAVTPGPVTLPPPPPFALPADIRPGWIPPGHDGTHPPTPAQSAAAAAAAATPAPATTP